MDDFSFVRSQSCNCMHKIMVPAPDGRGSILVPCGTCPACLLRKSIHNEVRVKTAQSYYKHCIFISLSYDVFHCPSYTIDETPIGSDLFRCTIRDLGHRNLRLEKRSPRMIPGFSRHLLPDDLTFTCNSAYLNRFRSQANLAIRRHSFDARFDGQYGYLCREDLALFMKRFRKHLFKTIPYEPLQTYFVGEYGVEHFRPHFHLLLFFNSDEIAACIGQSLNRSWRYGRVDWSENRKNATTYVASYLNSYVFLPRHLREIRKLRPFGRFSNGFAFEVFRPAVEAATQGIFTGFLNPTRRSINGSSIDVTPWSSIRNSVILSCCRERGATLSTCLRLLYSTWKLARFAPAKINTPYSLSLYFATRVRILFSLATSTHPVSSNLRTILYYIGYQYYIPPLSSIDVDLFAQRLYTLLNSTQKFMKTYNSSLFSFTFEENKLILPIINSIRFYREYFFKNFKDYIESCNRYPSNYRRYFFGVRPETQEELNDSGIGFLIKSYQHNLLLRRVKHREINEKNRFFVSA